MKPHFYKIIVKDENSFSAGVRIQPNFGKLWHYHPELELHYVVKGQGVRFVGDSIGNFEETELVLLGENLPHTWRCREDLYTEDKEDNTEAIVIQFLPEFLGKPFLSIPEALPIRLLFDKAKRGLLITGKTKTIVHELMLKVIEETGMSRILSLLSILNVLSQSNDVSYIANSTNFYKSNEAESVRLNRIYAHTMANFKEALPLEEIAKVANLSVTSFCRYFKMMTNKSYHEFLMEIRISHACRLLIEDNLSINAICYECGFGNVSNFYRYFVRIKNTTPAEFKKQYLEKKLTDIYQPILN
ncbi:AraC family transcriptional regulator [Mucilaginibacter pedocola]|uniref:AraC family transcriptional regulator n=1 Tax=Mucilaginibacter pedocola TaxID=1792845 RepID=A0A1S9PGT2_9SPHI|nr:AraC family transcriptional regulator [Mucilaginibacter pedocola]OOQ59768.1 AraC family transcriptional regulator [Mucilaginibacter pedocola]